MNITVKKTCFEDAAPKTHDAVFQLTKEVMTKKNTRFLIVGSGPGAFEKRLIEYGVPTNNIHSCDIAPERFSIREIKCKKCDLNEKIPFRSSIFDAVISIEVIEHLKNPWKFVEEVHRVLKKGGYFITSSPNVENIYAKVYFLLVGKLIWFTPPPRKRNKGKNTLELPSHVSPIFGWYLNNIIRNKFIIEKKSFNRPWIPLIKREFPFRLGCLAEINVWRLRKI
jgi:ubiquinone/menaquinone biosynthesis C-methylase UbiE